MRSAVMDRGPGHHGDDGKTTNDFEAVAPIASNGLCPSLFDIAFAGAKRSSYRIFDSRHIGSEIGFIDKMERCHNDGRRSAICALGEHVVRQDALVDRPVADGKQPAREDGGDPVGRGDVSANHDV